jgi:PDZ domain
MKFFFTTIPCLFLGISTVAAQGGASSPSHAVARITLVERTTDADGKIVERTVEKTGKEAEDYLKAHPEIQNATPGDIVTKKVTVTRKSIDPLTGQLKTERVVKEGADAAAVDLKKIYTEGATGLQQSFFQNTIATAGAQNIKVEKKQQSTKSASGDDASEDVEVMIDQTSDAENRAYLGVAAADLPSPKGVVIDFVLEDSPAAVAGLLEWDIITAVQGVPVRNAIELQKALAPFGPNDKVLISYYRKDKLEQTNVVLAASEAVGRTMPAKSASPRPEAAQQPMAKPLPPPAAIMNNTPTFVETDMPFKNYKLYPNPSGTGMFTVQFDLTPTDYLLMKVIDPKTGSELMMRIVNKQDGEFVYQMDLQRQKPGDYILSITHNGTTYTKELHYRP